MTVGIITERIERNRGLDALGVDAIPSSAGEVIAATAEDFAIRNPMAGAFRFLGRERADTDALIEEAETGRQVLLEPDQANERFGIEGELKFDRPISETAAGSLYDLKRDELRRQAVFRRSPGGFALGAAQLGVGLGVSLLDPINIASAFIPVVGQARYALWLERAGSLAARTGVRARVGAVEGAVGAALVEPIVYGAARSEQADYDATDSLLNIAFGTVLGGGLHAAAGAIGDRITGRFAREIEAMSIETREEALRSAVAQVAEGRPVDIELVLLRRRLEETTSLAPVERTGPVIEPARAEAQAAPTEPRTVVPFAPRDEGYTTFETRAEAEAEAERGARRTKADVEIVETPEGFTLVRKSGIEPLREPDGTPRLFDTERAAQRESRHLDRALSVLPVAPDGGPVRYALVENATPQDIAAAKARPELVDLGRAEDRSVAAFDAAREAERASQAAEARRRLDAKVAEIVRAGEGRYAPPEDLETARVIEQRQASEPDRGEDPERMLEAENARVQNDIRAEALSEQDKAEIAEADALIERSGRLGKAYEAAAACVRRNP